MKFCIDCKHYRRHPDAKQEPQLGLCDLFEKRDENYPVTGKTDFQFCSTARISELMCGADGSKYEPRLEIPVEEAVDVRR